jgi:hypothetical protein
MSVDVLAPSPSAGLPDLSVVAAMGEAIEQASTTREVLNLRLRCDVLRDLAARYKAVDREGAVEIQREASRQKLKCERRLGEMLRELDTHRRSLRRTVGGQLAGSEKVLPDGISKQQKEKWSKLAALPEAEFEAWADRRKEADEELTQKSLLAEAEAYIARKRRELESNSGCGGSDEDDADTDEDDNDDDDLDDEDEDSDESYVQPIQFNVTAAEHQEILADLPMMQAFFDTDNRADTLMALWRRVRRAIQEEQE